MKKVGNNRGTVRIRRRLTPALVRSVYGIGEPTAEKRISAILSAPSRRIATAILLERPDKLSRTRFPSLRPPMPYTLLIQSRLSFVFAQPSSLRLWLALQTGAQPPPVRASRSRYACLSRVRLPWRTRSAGQSRRFAILLRSGTGPLPLSASPIAHGRAGAAKHMDVRERSSPSPGVPDAIYGLRI